MGTRNRLGAERVVRPAPLRPFDTPNVTALLGVIVVLVCGLSALFSGAGPRLDVQLPLDVARLGTVPLGGCDDQIVVHLHADGTLAVNTWPVASDALPAWLREIYAQRKCKDLYLRPDPDVPYGKVASFVDRVRGTGAVEQIIMVTGNEWGESSPWKR